MKVSDVMQTQVDYVFPDTPLKDVARLIFGHKINGVPVCKDKKIIGFITEHDILSQFYPTQQEYIEDYVHARDFEGMEEKVKEILDLPAERVMHSDITVIAADAPLLKAQSLMQVRKIGRLPVIDENSNLLGIIAKGDIFKALVGTKIPSTDLERYHNFLSKYYDVFVEWNKRLRFEIPSLVRLLKKGNVQKVLDVGCGTGEHDIELAKKGFYVVGIDNSTLMIKIANEKRNKLSESVKKNVHFVLSGYKNLQSELKEEFDGALFLGNALPYIIPSTEHVLREVVNVLRQKKPSLIFQILNFDKILGTKNRLLSFKIVKSSRPTIKEHLFLEFYDYGKKGVLFHNLVVFDSYDDNNKGNWLFKEIITLPIRYVSKNEISSNLKKNGFSKISFFGTQGEYQGAYGQFPGGEFKSLESDWLNIVAKR